MSHVVSIKTELRDLEAVKRACKELGLIFNENAKSIRWFGRWMADYNGADAAFKLGIKTEDYGKCDHSISVPGSDYDIGLLKNPQTGGYKMYFDYWGSNGHTIQERIGQSGEKLLQIYTVHKATMEAQKKGYLVRREYGKGGAIQLTVTGM